MQRRRFALAAAVLLNANTPTTFAFVPAITKPVISAISSSPSDVNHADDVSPPTGDYNRNPLKAIKPMSLAVLTAASSLWIPKEAMASAPVTPIKNFKPPDSKAIALKKINDARNQEKMKEQMAHQIKCDEIEEAEGKEARLAYEKAFEDKKILMAEERSVNRKKLMYGLVDMGLCPFVDVEGERQLYLFDNGIDLNKVPATTQQKEMMNLKRDKKLVARREKERFLIKCIVEDQKLQGNDPLKYLEENQVKTKEIINMKTRQLDAMVTHYQGLLQTQGSVSGVKVATPFNMAAAVSGITAPEVDAAAAEKAAKAAEIAKVKAEKAAQKVEAKALQAAQKAEAKALKVAEKAKVKALKDAEKAKAKALRDAKKAEKVAAKEALNAEKAASEVAVHSVPEASAEEDVAEDVEVVSDDITAGEMAVETIEDDANSGKSVSKGIKGVPVINIVGVVGGVGGGYAFMQKSKASKEAEELERQRQFKLIMGLDEEIDDEDDDGSDDEPLNVSKELNTLKEDKTTAPISEIPKKKKRRGLASVFAKKNTRETDLNSLVASDADAPEFASLLAKILSFGAPGRFPAIKTLPGGMPMETFDLEAAKASLVMSRSSASLSDEAAAEQFACVVNCMIIDIIDLASSSLGLKEKKDSATIDALNVVMDFMDHAASLFDAVADGVTINPVTYGGSLSKSKLEQMFAIYSSSGLTSMDGSVTQDRIDTLQQVFNINDKRAEGLVQKAMMKNLMNMMKDGGEGGMEEMLKGLGGMEGMEGMEEMMAAMAGEGGMPGFGDGEDISPEQLKASVKMMKELIDSGSVSKEELGLVREQFKTMYGSDINELIKAADEEGGSDDLGEDGAELLELFKEILKED